MSHVRKGDVVVVTSGSSKGKRGKVLKVGVVQSGAVTGTGTVATAVNGNAIAGGSLSVTGGAAGTLFTAVPTTTSTRTMSSRSRHPAPPAPRPARSSP